MEASVVPRALYGNCTHRGCQWLLGVLFQLSSPLSTDLHGKSPPLAFVTLLPPGFLPLSLAIPCIYFIILFISYVCLFYGGSSSILSRILATPGFLVYSTKFPPIILSIPESPANRLDSDCSKSVSPGQVSFWAQVCISNCALVFSRHFKCNMDKTELNMLTALKSVPLLIVLIQANYTTQLIIIVPSTCHVLVSGTVHNALYGLLHQILIITLRDRSTVSIALTDEQRETNLQAHVPSSVANLCTRFQNADSQWSHHFPSGSSDLPLIPFSLPFCTSTQTKSVD